MPSLSFPSGPRPVLLAMGLLIASLSIPVSPGGAADAPAASPRVEHAQSELVLIEVYARDKQGQPVRDLRPGDLILRIDEGRRAVPIASLDWVEAPVELPPGVEVETPSGAAAGPTAAVPAGEGRGGFPRRFLFFFEDSVSQPTGMTAARLAALDFVDRAGRPSDQIALVSWDAERQLVVLHDFTTDRAALRHALEGSLEDARRFSDYAIARETRREDLVEQARLAGLLVSGSDLRLDTPILRPPAQVPDPRMGTQGQQPSVLLDQVSLQDTVRDQARDYAALDAQVMSRILSAVGALVDAMSAWPGYKALIFMGDGIPDNPTSDYGLNELRGSLAAELGGLARAVSGANVTMHVIEPGGVATGDTSQIATASRRSNALAALALGTGGMHQAANDLGAALVDVEQGASGYYVLAYAPEGPPDGRHHTIDIKTHRKGVRLRYRDGFTRFTPDEARARALQAAFVAPDLNRGLGVQAAAVAGPMVDGRRVYDLVFYVPPERLLFLPGPAGRAARVEMGLVVIGIAGHPTLRLNRQVDVVLDPRRPIAGVPALDFFSRVTLPEGSQVLTAVVSDTQSGEIGAARLSLERAAADTPLVTGLALYARDEKSLWIGIDAQAKGQVRGNSSSSTVGPALRTRFTSDEKVACAFRAAVPAGAAPPGMRIEILSGADVVLVRPIDAADLAPVSGGDGSLVHVDLSLLGLEAGDYQLRVRAGHDDRPSEAARLSFQIDAATAD